jgi:hypothetical protein
MLASAVHVKVWCESCIISMDIGTVQGWFRVTFVCLFFPTASAILVILLHLIDAGYIMCGKLIAYRYITEAAIFTVSS